MGIALNYTMFLCTIVNSALTTTIVGVLKGVGSTVRECFEEMRLVRIFFDILRCQWLTSWQSLGFFLLGGVQIHALNVTGLVINTAGGVWYSLAKYYQKRNRLPKLTSDVETHRK